MRTFYVFLGSCLLWVSTGIAEAVLSWTSPQTPEPNSVTMGGVWGDAYQRGLACIGRKPYSAPLVLADVNFGTNRWFTNFSGDLSGRFLELASLSSTPQNPQPAILREVMEHITQYQKPDGHFGADVAWDDPKALAGAAWDSKVMPIFWGNGRLLLGEVAACKRFGDPRLLQSARKLGDFYANVVVKVFCDPNRVGEYQQPASYACAYVTCVFEGMEGLVRLYQITKDQRYLDVARKMADFHERFDTLPVGHSHGSLSEHEALVLLYEVTGDVKYLQRVTDRWERIVKEGFVYPSGGVLEKFCVTGFNRDEGCSEADWLRLNLMLWRNTGETRYLDMAERELWGEYQANQWPSGGYGHRFLSFDETGPNAYEKYSEEAFWCCEFHGPLGLYDLKGYLAVGSKQGIFFNFPVEFESPVQVNKGQWKVSSKTLAGQPGIPVRCEVSLERVQGLKRAPLFIRVPEWADQVTITSNGKSVSAQKAAGYLCTKPLASGTRLEIAYHARPYLETRRCERIVLTPSSPNSYPKVVVRYGPGILFNSSGSKIEEVTLDIAADGGLRLSDATAKKLVPWVQLSAPAEPHAFVFNVQLNRPQ